MFKENCLNFFFNYFFDRFLLNNILEQLHTKIGGRLCHVWGLSFKLRRKPEQKRMQKFDIGEICEPKTRC